MSNVTIRQALEWGPETNWGENVSTFPNRCPIIAPVDLGGVKHDKIDSGRVTQYLQELTEWIIGPQVATFKTRFCLFGHGLTMVGAPTVSTHEQLLAYAMSNPTATSILSAAASTTAAAGGTVTALNTVASATFGAGTLFRAGVRNDTRGGGQMYPVGTHVGTVLTPLVALPGALNATDLITPVVNLFLPESANGNAIGLTGVRFLLRTANLCYEFHGCFASGLTFGDLNTGKPPWVEIEWTASWWQVANSPLPSAITNTAFNPAPVGTGSFFVGDVGTPTRAAANLRSIRDFQLSVKLGVVGETGPGGVSPYQQFIAARRTNSDISLQWTEDADATTATPVLDGYWTGGAPKHVMYTLSTNDGSSVGFYFPQVRFTGTRPMQGANDNVNRLTIMAMAGTGPTTTSETTLAAMRIGLA